MTDVGMVQRTPLDEDLVETVSLLSSFLPFKSESLSKLGMRVQSTNCRLVLCDISPLGIVLARHVGIPSVLIENFTWDWIYEPYSDQAPAMKVFGDYLKECFEATVYRIQTRPVCVPARADLLTPPVSRAFRAPPEEVRRQLGIAPHAKVITVTMGGVADKIDLEGLDGMDDVLFVVPGGSPVPKRRGNTILLPRQGAFFHPDLIRASDGVVGKLGYSTLAEVFHAGVPFAYITRPNFRESAALATFAREEMQGFQIQDRSFHDGSWVARIPDLLDRPRIVREGPVGSAAAARFIVERIP